MLKGTITNKLNDQENKISIDECDMLFVIGVKKLKDDAHQIQGMTQNIMLGGGFSTKFIVECLTESLISQLKRLGDDDPACTYAILERVGIRVSQEVEKYRLSNIRSYWGTKEMS